VGTGGSKVKTPEQFMQVFAIESTLETVTVKRLTDGREVQVLPLTYGRARVAITNRHNPLCYDDSW
jgi:hypothetical protein